MGIGDWGLGPIPNPQSPIPFLRTPYNLLKFIFLVKNLILNIISILIMYIIKTLIIILL
jgi:hypothetical protein